METLQQMQQRILSFSIHSLYCREDGCFETHPNVKMKVDEEGKMKPFYGNSMIFQIKDQIFLECCWHIINEIQQSIMMAEPLKNHTMHMTLHDLVNGTTPPYHMEEVNQKAIHILQSLPDFEIKLKPSRVYSMNQTSIVLGMEAINEEHHQKLMSIYECFQEVVPLSYAYTPHVTISYYRPNIYPHHDVLQLQKIMADVNAFIGNITLVLRKEDLKLMVFTNMNEYQEVA